MDAKSDTGTTSAPVPGCQEASRGCSRRSACSSKKHDMETKLWAMLAEVNKDLRLANAQIEALRVENQMLRSSRVLRVVNSDEHPAE